MGKLGKHDHKLTNLLKGGIFSLIMLAPLIAIGVRCLYVINNKNAKDSYSGSTTYLSTTNYKSFIENKPINVITYTLDNTNYYYYSSTNFNNLELDVNNPYNENLRNAGYIMFNTDNLKWQGQDYSNIQSVVITNTNSNIIAYCYNVPINEDYFYLNGLHYLDANTTINPIYTTNSIYNKPLNVTANLTINRIYSSMTTSSINNYYKYLSLDIYLNDATLSSVFDASINQLSQSKTFNWVQNTAIYTPLNAMCSGLGITESAIPILLCYWSLMTAIYIVFDIIIYLFTKMTHFIGTN